MKLPQLVISLSLIARNEHTGRAAALLRHLLWQTYKIRGPRAVRRRLSHSMLMDDEAGSVIGLVNMLGTYDYNNMNFVKQIVAEGTIFVDVGANIGSYTLIASEQPGATVISLEPNPTAFAKLKRNVELNNRPNVVAINCGASSCRGFIYMTNNGSSPINQIINDHLSNRSTIEVSIDTVDGICAALYQTPTLIKIDVEGHELEVLKGATNCLSSAVACIVENGDQPVIADLMRTRGMRGPFYYQHKLRCLQLKPQRLIEDPIYIGLAFQEHARKIHIES